MAKSAMVGLDKICVDRGITKVTETRLVSLPIFPMATYGCETWSLNRSDRKMINSCGELWCRRWMLRICLIIKRTNDSVLQEFQPKIRLLYLSQSQMLSYFGHIARGYVDCLEKVIMQGSRKPGRPRTT